MPAQISVRIDGELCTATEGQTIFEVADGQWQVHSLAVPPRRGERRRLLPPVPRRGVGGRPSPARLHHAGPARHGGHHHVGPPEPSSAPGAGAAVRRAQPLLRGLRVQRPLRTAGAGRSASASPTSAIPTTRRASPSTCRIRASSSTTTAASCAAVACGCATRSKAPTSGTSAAAASARAWWPN